MTGPSFAGPFQVPGVPNAGAPVVLLHHRRRESVAMDQFISAAPPRDSPLHFCPPKSLPRRGPPSYTRLPSPFPPADTPPWPPEPVKAMLSSPDLRWFWSDGDGFGEELCVKNQTEVMKLVAVLSGCRVAGGDGVDLRKGKNQFVQRKAGSTVVAGAHMVPQP